VPDRVQDDIRDGGFVRIGVLDHLGPVAPPEKMVDPTVALVEGACVAAVQISHPLVEVRFGRLHNEVEVIAHQAGGVDLPAVAFLDPAEQPQQETAVVVIEDDRAVVVAAGDDVVHRSGFEVAVRSAHGTTLARRSPWASSCAGAGAPLSRSRDVPGTRQCLFRRGASGERGGYAATFARSRC
jgi:hypothetical protein